MHRAGDATGFFLAATVVVAITLPASEVNSVFPPYLADRVSPTVRGDLAENHEIPFKSVPDQKTLQIATVRTPAAVRFASGRGAADVAKEGPTAAIMSAASYLSILP